MCRNPEWVFLFDPTGAAEETPAINFPSILLLSRQNDRDSARARPLHGVFDTNIGMGSQENPSTMNVRVKMIRSSI